MAELDRFPVKDLQNRYNLGRTALYERFKFTHITPTKDGTRSYVSGEQLEELDRLDLHIKAGGKLEDFHPKVQSTTTEMVTSPQSATDNFEVVQVQFGRAIMQFRCFLR